MDAFKRKKARQAARAEAKAKAKAEAEALANYVPPELSSEDEEIPPPLKLAGKVLTLAPGSTITLLPSAEAPPPPRVADVEEEFQLQRPNEPFVWGKLPPGRRPDTLVVRGLPYSFFGLFSPATLQRHHVASGASGLRRVLATFGAVWDLDVRTHDATRAARAVADKKAASAANIWKFKAVTQKREIEAVDLLTADKIRAALTARQLDATGLKAVVAARLKEAILADGQIKNNGSSGDGGTAKRSSGGDGTLSQGNEGSRSQASPNAALIPSETGTGTRPASSISSSGAPQHTSALSSSDGNDAFTVPSTDLLPGQKEPAAKEGDEEERPHSATNALMTGRDFDGLFAAGGGRREEDSRPTSATSALDIPSNDTTAAVATVAAAPTTGKAPRSQQPLPPRRLRRASNSKLTPPSGSSKTGVLPGGNAGGGAEGGNLPSPPASRGSRRAAASARASSRENNDEESTSFESETAAAAAPTTFTTQGLPTFEALVCFRSYEGFIASLEGFGGQMLMKRDPKDGTDYYAPLTVEVDYSSYFSAEGLAQRAAAERQAIKAAARRSLEAEHAILRLLEGTRASAQAGRVAATEYELIATDFETEHLALVQSSPELQDAVHVASVAMAALRDTIAVLEGSEAELLERLKDVAGLEGARADCRDALQEAKHAWHVAEKLRRRLKESSRLNFPPLQVALKQRHCSLFASLVQHEWHALGLSGGASNTPYGCTLFVPNDGAFLGDLANWEHECWPLHVVEVPLLVGDMINFPGGRVQPVDRDPKHALRVRADLSGKPSVWVFGDSDPPRKATVILADLKIDDGVIVHIIDRILYPP